MYGVWFRLQIKRLWQKSCHSPFFPNKRCSPVNSSVTSQNIQQTWEAVFWNCSLWLGDERQAHDLFLQRCSISWPSVLAQTNGKIRGTIFPFVSLTIRSKRWFHNLSFALLLLEGFFQYFFIFFQSIKDQIQYDSRNATHYDAISSEHLQCLRHLTE